MNQIVDLNKKVLSAAQTRVMAEIYAEQMGLEYHPKTSMAIAASAYLTKGGEFIGALPDFYDYNISMGVLERWKNMGANLYDREWNIGSDGTGYYADLRMNQNSKGIPKRQEINNADSPIIAIAEALQQIEEK